MTNEYKKAGLFYFVGNIFNKGIAFVTVPVFTRLLTTTDYGIVTTYNSWVSILTLVFGLAIYMGIRAAFIDYKEKINDFMSVSTTFTLVSGVLMSFLIGGGALVLKINVSFAVLFFCLIQGLASALIQNYLMYLMMEYKYKFRTALMILPNLLSVIVSICVIVFILKTDLYMGRIIPSAIVSGGFALLTILLVYKKSRMLFNKKYLVYALKISAPLVLHGLALYVLSQSDRIMITWLADASQTGIYSLVYNFSMIATVITTALEGVWVPWFTEKLKNKDRNSINKLSTYYINIMMYAMIAIILVGPEVIRILASKPYWEGIIIIPPVVLANYVIFAYTMYVNVEHFYKKTPYITLNTLVAAIINIVLNYVFIPKYGYVAAAYTTLASYIVSFVLHSRYAKKIEPTLYPLKYFVKSLLCISVSTIVFYLFKDYWYVRWSMLVCYILFIVIHEKDKIFDFIKIKK